MQLAQAMQTLQGAGVLPGQNASGGPGAGLGAGGMPDFSSLLSSMAGGLGGLGMPAAAAPVANPEEAYATQLQQLQDMGFFSREENIRALVACGGNVQAAIERLL
jgi:ubiquilin